MHKLEQDFRLKIINSGMTISKFCKEKHICREYLYKVLREGEPKRTYAKEWKRILRLVRKFIDEDKPEDIHEEEEEPCGSQQ